MISGNRGSDRAEDRRTERGWGVSQKRLWKWDYNKETIASVPVLRETDKMFFIERTPAFGYSARIEKRHFGEYSLSREEAIHKQLANLKDDDELCRIGLKSNKAARKKLRAMLEREVTQKKARRR